MKDKISYSKSTKWGTMRSDSPFVMKYLYYMFAAFLFLGPVGLAVLFLSDFEMMKDVIWLLALAVSVSLIFGLVLLNEIKKMNKAYKAFKEEVRIKEKEHEADVQQYRQDHPYPEAEDFFIKARAAGVADLNSKANNSRLILFARNNNIPDSDEELVAKYNLGKQYVEAHEMKEQNRQKQERLDALRKLEAEMVRECTQYAKYLDQNKSIQMCKDKIFENECIIRECEADEENVRSGGNATYLAGRQKESSWAIHGGIANGIAGGAAGLAVAIDTERRNEQKRQQNAELSKNIASLMVMQLEQIWKRKRSAEFGVKQWTEKLETSKQLLCETLDQDELLSMLNPSVESAEISETGAVLLKVKLQNTSELMIYDDVKAAVDGSIQVQLKVDGEIAGVAVCVLPYGGTRYSATVRCICYEPSIKADEYEFDFAPNRLWGLEYK